jgi:DNA-binding response OmpR family regulator
MLTARAAEADRVRGLDGGADDYLTKPFGLPELLARLRALLRRCAPPAATRIMLGDLAIDPAARRIEGPAAALALSALEAAILTELAAAGGAVVPRRRLVERCWAETAVADRAVDFHLANLRRKLAQATGRSEPRHLLTAHGRGWSLVAG